MTLELHHEDPELCIPLLVAHDLGDIAADWRSWSEAFGIPMLMVKLGRDPALGSSVLITAVTDSGGFFIFLGLATIFLL